MATAWMAWFQNLIIQGLLYFIFFENLIFSLNFRQFLSLIRYFGMLGLDRAFEPLFFYFEVLELKLPINLSDFVIDAKELTLYF